jgi:hypothetical protein
MCPIKNSLTSSGIEMAKYLFTRVDIHYVEIEADSEEEAEAEVLHVSCMDNRVETYQGYWKIEEEQT